MGILKTDCIGREYTKTADGLFAPIPLSERFWRKAKQNGQCWEWQGHTKRNGYGSINVGGGRFRNAHRVAWELANHQLVPEGRQVLHNCDNRRCVRPDHLRLGTHADNMRDMQLRGRAGRHNKACGEANARAKLTVAKVQEIRRQHIAGKTYAAIGRAFGVRYPTISLIVRRKTWRHVR
jgi:hypothetical protein